MRDVIYCAGPFSRPALIDLPVPGVRGEGCKRSVLHGKCIANWRYHSTAKHGADRFLILQVTQWSREAVVLEATRLRWAAR
ncbi:unnamed protein product, partial [Iphiclides podalirius]